jgi:radical SAM superfamily enzyme YgiQ (UPF0313 family)
MKFLLAAINAKYIHSNPAIYSLRAYAGEENAEYTELAEYTINQPLEEILADIYRRRPDVIGFSCYIWNWNYVRRLLPEIPKVMPGTDIWLGGPEVTYDAELILKQYPVITGIMVGEGEQTYKELLEIYIRSHGRNRCDKKVDIDISEELHQVKGLCLHDGYTDVRELTDLTAIPFLYTEENIESFKNKIIYYESSRGCPYRCSYCLSSIDKKVRLRDTSVVKRELQFFLDHNIPQVKFVDRTFNCNHEHSMEIWKYIHEHDNGVTNFHFEISADILKEDEIALLNKMRPGLVQLEIGVQSVNQDTISAIQRVMNVERLEKIVNDIRSGNNIHQHLDLIAGLPYEDYDSFGKSFDSVYAMKPDQLQLGFLKVLKGSAMHEKAEEYGIRYTDTPPYEVLCTDWLSYDDVLRLKEVEEMVELYYNSSQYTHTLPFLVRKFATPFAMFEAMADFYKEKGFFINAPARAYRYEALLEFAVKYDADNAEVYRELLTYDMYLRENLKSRPVFAIDITEEGIKADIREFYTKEETERKYLPDYRGYDARQLMRMTHMEPFTYPVWDIEGLEETIKGTQEETKKETIESTIKYVLFDYNNRNPLTYEAGVQIISK